MVNDKLQHSEGFFSGASGRQIYHQCWSPTGAPRGILLLVHGAGEHSARYADLAACCVERGWVVAALDHHGHGRSEGTPGDMPDFADFAADVHTLHTLVRGEFPGIPSVLLGHSLGALIACHYLLDYPGEVLAAALSGPLIKTPQDPGKLERLAISLLAALLPKLGMVALDASGVSRDAAVVSAYVSDPLVYHGKMRARQLREMFAAMDVIAARAPEINVPLLIMHGGADSMTDPVGSKLLHGWVGSQDKTLTIYPGLYHEIFNEPEKDEVLASTLDWCESRLAG